MQFDPSVFCLPFVLPTESLQNSSSSQIDNASLLPSNTCRVNRAPSTPPYSPSSSSLDHLLSNSSPRIIGDIPQNVTALVTNLSSEMGIAGGAGSGSSLGSKARVLPVSKYQGTAPNTGAENGLLTSSVSMSSSFGNEELTTHSSSGSTSSTNNVTLPDSETIRNDLALLMDIFQGKDDNATSSSSPSYRYKTDLVRGTNDTLHGITRVNELTASITNAWWLSSGYTRLTNDEVYPFSTSTVPVSTALINDPSLSPLMQVAEGILSRTVHIDGKSSIANYNVLNMVASSPGVTNNNNDLSSANVANVPSSSISTKPPPLPSLSVNKPDSRSSVLSTGNTLARPALWGDHEDEEDAVIALSNEIDKDINPLSPSLTIETENDQSRARAQAVCDALHKDPFHRLSTVPSSADIPQSSTGSSGGNVATETNQSRSTLADQISPDNVPEVPVTIGDEQFDKLLDKILDTTMNATTAIQTIQDTLPASKLATKLSQRKWAITKRMTEEEVLVAETKFKPAHTWSFKLDMFQREAIIHMELEGTTAAVFVSAHTSAGKTVVAEYAMAKAITTRTRAIYTSPIKALSNQKYNDLRHLFGGPNGDGVGLITGDVSIHADAPILIMTTEILRSMLYRGDPLIRDISWVIFDEIHYINDEDRGLAYEETLLLLPEHIGLVFLSATSPNAEAFAEWVGRTKRKPVYVVGTLKRPTPLNHHLYVTKTKSMRLIMDGGLVDLHDIPNGFKTQNYKLEAESLKALLTKQGGASAYGASKEQDTSGRAGGGRTKREKQAWSHVMNVLKKDDLLPAIVFSFSKVKCEDCAYYGLSSVDFTTAREKSSIHIFLETAIKRLSPADRNLPQILRMRSLLVRGIGVHHSGLLPILKECVELLFSRGLVRVLFATETFAMGVNMPARTVIFNGLRKHDGMRFRELMPGEYTQMAGRAGRRGLDTRGNIIILAWGDYLPSLPTLQKVMMGVPTRLTSQFRLTYNMMLNVIRTDLPVTSMMSRSYAEFATQRALGGRDVPRLLLRGRGRLQSLIEEADAIPCILKDSTIGGSKSVNDRLDLGVIRATNVKIKDIEDIIASGAPSNSSIDLYRNTATIGSFYDANMMAQKAHMAMVREMFLNARTFPVVLCPGRVIVLDKVFVPWASNEGSSTGKICLRHIPAVIITADKRTPSNNDAVPNKTETERYEVDITVVLLCPPGYTFVSPLPVNPKNTVGNVSTNVSVTLGGGGLVAKRKDDIDDFADYGGKKGGKMTTNKNNKDADIDAYMGGGGKGGKKGGNTGTTGKSTETNPVPVSDEPDYPLSMGYFQSLPIPITKGSTTVRNLVAGVVRVPLRDVGRITGHTVGTNKRSGTDNPLINTVLSDGGSTVALRTIAIQLNDLLITQQCTYKMQDLPLLPSDNSSVSGTTVTSPITTTTTTIPYEIVAPRTPYYRLASIHPTNDFKPPLNDLNINEYFDQANRYERSIGTIKCDQCYMQSNQWMSISRIRRLQNQLNTVRARFSIEALSLYPEMQVRFNILRRLGYTKPGNDSPNVEETMAGTVVAKPTLDVVALKGRVAGEMNTCNELIITEALFEGIFNPLSPAECAALLSSLVFEEKSKEEEGDILKALKEVILTMQASNTPTSTDNEPTNPSMDYKLVQSVLKNTSKSASGEDADENIPTEETITTEADDTTPADDTASNVGSVTEGTTVGTVEDKDTATTIDVTIPTEEAPVAEYAGPVITMVSMNLIKAAERLRTMAIALGQVQVDCGLKLIPTEFAASKLNFGLLVPAYAWGCGVPFSVITLLTNVAEGTLVRSITRLDEACREVRNAARIMGDPVLYRKMEAASTAIKRDVIFAASLYHSG